MYACFTDLSKAFERIDQNVLIRKLLRDKIPSYIVNILSSFLGRVKCVYISTPPFPIVGKLSRVSDKGEFYLPTFFI